MVEVATVQGWFDRDAINTKYFVTKLESARIIMEWNYNTSNLFYDEIRNGPPRELLHHYVARYQATHQDHCPVDVSSIRWLTRRESTLQFLSLERNEDGPFRRAMDQTIVYLNDTIELLDALGCSIRYGQRMFNAQEIEEVPLFIQMEWMQNYKTPPQIMHHWMVLNRFLHDIQSIVPRKDYEANKEWIDNWFSAVHAFWGLLLKDVRNHLFFRKFRRIEDIPRFQHSVRWTMFFFKFVTTGDPPAIVALKEIIISNSVFKNGIRDFIAVVEKALYDVKPIVFHRNLTCNDYEQMNVEKAMIMDALNPDDWYQQWWAELLKDSFNQCRSILADAISGDLSGHPPKEVLAASLLWDMERLVAYIEPILFDKQHLHRMLLSLRHGVRCHIFHFILTESWC